MKRLLVIILTIFTLASGSANERFSFKDTHIEVAADSVFRYDCEHNPRQIDVHLRYALAKSPSNKSKLVISLTDKMQLSGYSFIINWEEREYDDFDGDRRIVINVKDICNDSITFTRKVANPKDADLYRGENYIEMFGNKFSGIDVYFNENIYLGKLPWFDGLATLSLRSSIKTNIKMLRVKGINDNTQELSTNMTYSDIVKIVDNSNDSIVGIYRYLDRENDARLAAPGGKYILAVVPGRQCDYDIIYISGAKIHPAGWKTGMIKGHLHKTIFINHFDLVWYDSTQDKWDEDIYASVTTENQILELNFPLLKTKFRLSKMPQGCYSHSE